MFVRVLYVLQIKAEKVSIVELAGMRLYFI